ncbi:MAG: beta-propeller fold lactonase family protein, partial [Gemmatimonadaceae bacterium]
DGRHAYVTAENGGTLSFIDARRNVVTDRVKLEGGTGRPVGVVASRNGARVYVTNGRASTVSVVDATTHRVLGSIPVGRRPWGVALTRDDKTLFTANGLSNSVSVIDTPTNRVVATIPVGTRPWGVALVE